MTRIVRDEAICLRSRPWRETSKLVTLFTRGHGRLVVMAKGARRPLSKFGAGLEVLTLARVVFYRREGRHAHTLADADIVEAFPKLRSLGPNLAAGAVVVEFADRCFEAEVPHPGVFGLMRESLRALDALRGESAPVALSFLLRAAGLLGYAPEFGCCISCRRTRAATFSTRRGGFLCARCAAQDPESVPVTGPTLHGLRCLAHHSFEQNRRAPLAAEVRDIVVSYLQFHLDRFDLKSLRRLPLPG